MQKKEPKAKSIDTSKKVRRKEQPQAEQKKQELQIVCSSSEIESETTSKEPTKPEIFEDPSKIAGDEILSKKKKEIHTKDSMQKKEPKAKSIDTSKKVRRKEQPQAEQKKQELQIVCSSSEIESETTSKEPTKPEIFEDPSKIAGDEILSKKKKEIHTKDSMQKKEPKAKSIDTSKKVRRKEQPPAEQKKQELQIVCSSSEIESETTSKEPTKPEIFEDPSKKAGDEILSKKKKEIHTKESMQKKEPKAKTSKKVRRKEQPQAEQKKQELQIVCSSSEIESETTSKEPTKPEIFEDPSKIAGDEILSKKKKEIHTKESMQKKEPKAKSIDTSKRSGERNNHKQNRKNRNYKSFVALLKSKVKQHLKSPQSLRYSKIHRK
ncbi:hypothetical protein TNCT_451531 [Trichonephila clavata]|uniref:Uncharacterized protein n=1 Tax=Trichonephila clavata TaxID=2740835 RepID=A0A8X6G3E6_TRICU|nr:hypothetical protein TNCT_451531 [Trichonephila clavata]